jgi:WD40 repeat protein/serine/threonine protein kinase
MPPVIAPDEALMQRLPLPLAQLYRRAHNAKTALERHNTAFFLWEAGLKLLGSVAVVEYAERATPDPQLAEALQCLARPSLGQWWALVRKLVPVLAGQEDADFERLRELLLAKSRDDLPRLAGLDAVLRGVIEGGTHAQSSIAPARLFDRLVQYRNQDIGHGAHGRRPAAHYEAVGAALLAGIPELWCRLDCLAGRRLMYVAEVRRQPTGNWEVDRFELIGESGRRIEPQALADSEQARLPCPDCVYLERAGGAVALHPLVIYDAAEEEVLFLNAQRGKRRAKYLAYTSGRSLDRAELRTEQRVLLARVLGTEVERAQAETWAQQSGSEESAAESAAESATESADELATGGPANQQVGEFELLSELGRGGMGIVYRAWQPSLGRQVALKVLQRIGDAQAEARFAREIRALGRVDHPHLVKIFTSSAAGDHWYYAMELIEGATLAALRERLQGRAGTVDAVDAQTWQRALSTVCEETRNAEKPLSDSPRPAAPARVAAPTPIEEDAAPVVKAYHVRQVVELMMQVAEAAHALHEAGVVHRDIKPGNILVTEDGSQAVLMDLGVAQLTGEGEGRLTRTQQFVGTLRYASPQQVLAVVSLDRRTDVYSLGATLWELLALRALFAATEATPMPELIEKIQREEPERLSRCNLGVSPDLEAIAHKCLEKVPEQRYATAHELARDLRRYLDGRPVRARPVARWERTWKWAKRHPAPAAVYGLLVLVAVLVVVGGTMLWLWKRGKDANERTDKANAELARVNAELTQKNKELTDTQAQLQRMTYFDRFRLAWRGWSAGHIVQGVQLLEDCDEAHRGWEWHHLHQRVRSEWHILDGHDGAVHQVAFSPTSALLASAGADGMVGVWNAETGQRQHELRGHDGPVRSVAISPDGSLVASAGDDAVVRLWGAADGKLTRTLQGHTGPVQHVAFSPDGTLLASAGTDGTVRLWDVASGAGRSVLGGQAPGLVALSFRRDARRLATAGAEAAVQLWQLDVDQPADLIKSPTTQDPRLRVPKKRGPAGESSSYTHVTFSPDGKLLAAAQDGKLVLLWDAESGKSLPSLKGNDDVVRHVAFSPDSRWLASAGDDRIVRLWRNDPSKYVTGGEPQTLRGHIAAVRCIEFSPDGRCLATAGDDGAVAVWSVPAPGVQNQAELSLLALRATPVASAGPGELPSLGSLAFSHDGRLLAAAGSDGRVRVWLADTGYESLALRGHTAGLTQVIGSPDGRFLASSAADGSIRLWSADCGKPGPVLAGHPGGTQHIAFSQAGELLASAGADGRVALWQVTTGTGTFFPEGHNGAVHRVAFSPDDTLVASAGADGIVRLWRTTTGKLVQSLPGHTRPVHRLAFSPDGKWLASAGEDLTVRLWKCYTDAERPAEAGPVLGGHQKPVTSLGFEPGDGHFLAWASRDGTVHLCDVDRGQESRVLRGHGGPVNDVAFAGKGGWLASGGHDGSVCLWQLANGRLVHTLRGKNGRVFHVAFSPDGARVAAAGSNRFAEVWDVGTGKELLALDKVEPTAGVAFCRAGTLLVAGGADHTLRVWAARITEPDREARRRFWPLYQAATCEGLQQWFSAAFHLGTAVRAQPDDARLHHRLGTALAELQLWDDAAREFAAAAERQPKLARPRCDLALVSAARGKAAELPMICRQLLTDFVASDDPLEGCTAAWIALLVPDSVDDLPGIISLTERALKLDPASSLGYACLGAARYRAGDYAAAVAALQKVKVTPERGDWPAAQKLLKMAERRLTGVAPTGKSPADSQRSAQPAQQVQDCGQRDDQPRPRWFDVAEMTLLQPESNALLGE